MKEVHLNSIFIVDDDPDDRQVILDAILATNPKLNYQLIENGEELISRLHAPEGHYPGLILLDLNMHGLTGLQTLKEIRKYKAFSQIAIIILTTSSQDSDRKAAYESGANCFINKPETYSQLIEMSEAIIKLFLVKEEVLGGKA